MDSTIKFGRIFGIPIGVHYSWFIVFLLVTFAISDEFSQDYQGWTASFVTAILFFLSVLIHELSHSLVALSKGIPVKGITLFIFGGVSQIGREANKPLTEFLIAIVGPVSSVLLGLAFWGLSIPLDWVNSDLATMARLLAWVNVVLGIFNMLPGFPLDGGRVLRAAIWWITRSYWTATRFATIAGQGIALLLIGLGVTVIILVSPTQGVWYILIGLFLGGAASASRRQFRQRERLKDLTARDLMGPHDVSVPATLTLRQLTEQFGQSAASTTTPVTQGGRVIGLIDQQSIAAIPRAEWEFTNVGAIAIPIGDAISVAPGADALSVLDLMEQKDLDHLFIVDAGALVGFIRRDSFQNFLQPRKAT